MSSTTVGKRFRKKPVVIEAEQWLGPETVIEGVRPATFEEKQAHLWVFAHHQTHYVIETLEGLHWVSPGDWIITGVKGEKYPCKPDIFAMTYEPMGEPIAASELIADKRRGTSDV